MPDPEATRGFRNRNPGNLDRVKGVTWQGELTGEAAKKQDSRFCVFKSHEHGIRALIRTLITYATARKARDGSRIDTVREVVDRWAPPVENDTNAYVKSVARAVGVGPDDEIDILDPRVMEPLVKAIISHECAGLMYPEETIRKAMILSGIHVPEVNGAEIAAMKEVEQPGSVEEKKDVSNKLAGIAAAAVALAGAVSGVVAELPKIVQQLDNLFPDDVNIIVNIWDWLPVGLSLIALVCIWMLAREMKAVMKTKVRNEL